MIILHAIMFLVPALIAVLLYERFRGYELIARKRIELWLVFAFLINLLVFFLFWLRGWENLPLTADKDSLAIATSFVLQYMLTASAAAIALAYILSLVRVGKRK